MIKKLAGSIREYKTPSLMTLLLMVFEVFFEVLIPFNTANLVNGIKAGEPMTEVLKTGLMLLAMAMASLCCGGLGAFTCSKASAGFAKNLRRDIFTRVQGFSFENIDRFSTASLVTRMTTDVNNVQMAYMMIIRIAVRAPLMFLFAISMAYIMGGRLATTFVVIVPVVVFGLVMIARKAMPAFRAVFNKYDKMNESIEENVRAMRVVKGFTREDYEKRKFAAASEDISRDFTKAQRIVALNSPLMQLCVFQHGVRPHRRFQTHHQLRRYHHRCGPDIRHVDLRHSDTYEPDDAFHGIRHAHHVCRVRQAYLPGAGRGEQSP